MLGTRLFYSTPLAFYFVCVSDPLIELNQEETILLSGIRLCLVLVIDAHYFLFGFGF